MALIVGGWGPMGGEGAVELSTQFTQTALSAREEALHCQTNGETGELVREAGREEGMEMDGGPEDEWRAEKGRGGGIYSKGAERTPVSRLDRQRVR